MSKIHRRAVCALVSAAIAYAAAGSSRAADLRPSAMLRVSVAALDQSVPSAAAPAPSDPAPPPVAPAPLESAAPTAHAHRTIATSDPRAQAAFNRGLLFMYAFNIGAAREAFRTAERADSSAALAYFGEAMVETTDINEPTTSDGERRGADAIARGRAAAAAAPSDERELFAAAALRFDAHRPQTERFNGLFHALQAYADTHPDDGMGATLAAYAGYNATGLLTAGPADDLIPEAVTMAGDLDRALRIDPDDVGAHHLRIHLWEVAHRPVRALSDADYLAALHYEPGESHLEHMAGHIYDRLGQYPQMIAVNRGACANDDVYFAQGDGAGQAYMRTYHEHDVDFVLYGLTTLGRNADAVSFAARESDYSREKVAVRLHDNASVLRLLGAAVTPLRIIAEARAGDVAAARTDLAGLNASGNSQAGFEIATAVVARAAHDDAAAIAAYRKASEASSTAIDPKAYWWEPIGEGLGATLLEARRPAEAERVFGDELIHYPNDPHLEFGLAEALYAQGKDDSVARRAYTTNWEGAQPLRIADLG